MIHLDVKYDFAKKYTSWTLTDDGFVYDTYVRKRLDKWNAIEEKETTKQNVNLLSLLRIFHSQFRCKYEDKPISQKIFIK